MSSQEFLVVGFITNDEIFRSLLAGRSPLHFVIAVSSRPRRVTMTVRGCRWEQNPHGGEMAEEMLILTGKDQDGDACELQLSFREQRARLAYCERE